LGAAEEHTTQSKEHREEWLLWYRIETILTLLSELGATKEYLAVQRMETTSAQRSTNNSWFHGVVRTLPIVLGYVAVGFAFGVLSQKAGLSALNTLALSVVVYAGSAQLIAVGLFAAGAPPLSIIATTLVVNLRHLLLSAALSPYLRGWRKREIAFFAYELTDETFAVHTTQFATGTPSKIETFAVNITAQAAWVAGTWLGLVAGGLITDVRPWALDYALPALFIALLVLQIKDRVQIVVAVLSGLLAVGLVLAGVDQWNVIIATLVGATVGVGVDRWIKRRSS
jgi:4-azaleucine resistance transporter AzlC